VASGASAVPPPPAPEKRVKSPSRPPINTAVILNRSPIITRSPSVFERAYYQYQQRIQRALHNPFPFEFYFKQGSLLETKFNLEEAKRDRKAFGRNFGHDKEGAFTKPAAGMAELGAEEDLGIAPRKGEADEKKDVKSLDRKGQRNLYLLLKKKEGEKERWTLPQGDVADGEILHEVR
jgi:large subunit ribosomal protein L46